MLVERVTAPTNTNILQMYEHFTRLGEEIHNIITKKLEDSYLRYHLAEYAILCYLSGNIDRLSSIPVRKTLSALLAKILESAVRGGDVKRYVEELERKYRSISPYIIHTAIILDVLLDFVDKRGIYIREAGLLCDIILREYRKKYLSLGVVTREEYFLYRVLCRARKVFQMRAREVSNRILQILPRDVKCADEFFAEMTDIALELNKEVIDASKVYSIIQKLKNMITESISYYDDSIGEVVELSESSFYSLAYLYIAKKFLTVILHSYGFSPIALITKDPYKEYKAIEKSFRSCQRKILSFRILEEIILVLIGFLISAIISYIMMTGSVIMLLMTALICGTARAYIHYKKLELKNIIHWLFNKISFGKINYLDYLNNLKKELEYYKLRVKELEQVIGREIST